MKTGLILLLISSCLVGIADASYLTWQKMQGLIPPCNAQYQCETVLNSTWAQIGPIPLSVFGILFYASFWLLAIAYLLGLEKISLGKVSLGLSTILLIWGIIGLIFSAYFVAIMGLVLQAWCFYCLISAVNCVFLAIVSSSLYFVVRKGEV